MMAKNLWCLLGPSVGQLILGAHQLSARRDKSSGAICAAWLTPR